MSSTITVTNNWLRNRLYGVHVKESQNVRLHGNLAEGNECLAQQCWIRHRDQQPDGGQRSRGADSHQPTAFHVVTT
ncbi:hypothetical protein SBA3_750003 [Candidatus Sulfopaludibacter sp. SbA3]|nr:hypothetical protein SBA3_750003 [Candidatus Sulfopaludibacter sp. SbA3]